MGEESQNSGNMSSNLQLGKVGRIKCREGQIDRWSRLDCAEGRKVRDCSDERDLTDGAILNT